MRPSLVNLLFSCFAGGCGAFILPLLLNQTARSEPSLLPFQGRLTDAAGNPIADGARVVEFKLYDAPTGGNVKWAGEVHKLSVNGGLVNTLLGSKASLGGVDFGTATFLQITVDANGDGAITAADPPLLPRQSVVPAVFAMEAGNSRKLNGADWTVLMVDESGAATGDPVSGFVKGSKIQAGGVTTTQLAFDAVTSAQIADGSIGTAEFANGSVTNPKLAAGAIGSTAILDGSVLAQDIADGAVTSAKVLDGALTGNDVAVNSIPLDRLAGDLAVFSHRTGPSVGGGAAVDGWSKRELNATEYVTDGSAITISGGAITLGQGVYAVRGVACFFAVDRAQAVIRDVTSLTPDDALVRGTPCVCSYRNGGGGSAANGLSVFDGIITAGSAGRTIELWHYCGAPHGGSATLGLPTDIGSGIKPQANVFARVVIERIR